MDTGPAPMPAPRRRQEASQDNTRATAPARSAPFGRPPPAPWLERSLLVGGLYGRAMGLHKPETDVPGTARGCPRRRVFRRSLSRRQRRVDVARHARAAGIDRPAPAAGVILTHAAIDRGDEQHVPKRDHA